MKSLSVFWLFALLVLGSGCFPLTEMVKERAEGYTHVNRKTEEIKNISGNPAYYALTPLSIPADVALTPILVLGFAAWWAAGFPGFTGH